MPNETPWLSILVPVYNTSAYLEECLTSILSQAHAGVEIIVLDDCSTDNSYALLQKIAANHPSIRLYKNFHNQGISATRNQLLDLATGEYIWFIDSDDKLEKTAISDLLKTVSLYSPDIIFCDYFVWNPKDTKTKMIQNSGFKGAANQFISQQDNIASGMLLSGASFAWSKVVKKSAWPTSIRFPENRYFEDMATCPQLGATVSSSYYAADPWVWYRQNPLGLTAKIAPEKLLDWASALIAVKERYQQSGLLQSAKVRFALAHASAKNFRAVSRRLKNHPALSPKEKQELIYQAWTSFLKSTPYTPLQLLLNYAMRGKISDVFQWARTCTKTLHSSHE